MSNLIENRKAGFNYEIGDKYEAGIELVGHEVKSIKAGRGNMAGSFIVIRGNEAYLAGLEIPPFQTKNAPEDYEPRRMRKLLLAKREILKLQTLEQRERLTLIPLSLYNKGRFIKVSFAVARGKKKTDKRQTIRLREDEREMSRSLKKLR